MLTISELLEAILINVGFLATAIAEPAVKIKLPAT